jgi:hypothetical protein
MYDLRILTCDPPIQPSDYEQSSCGSSRDNNPTTTMTTRSCGEEPTPADGEHLLPDTPGGISFAQLCEDDCTAIPPDRDVCKEDSRNRHRLYLSHELSTWNSRVFEFGAYLFLAGTWPRSLLPASIYALVQAAAAALFSPWLGSYIDHYDRLRFIRLTIRKHLEAHRNSLCTDHIKLGSACPLHFECRHEYHMCQARLGDHCWWR